MDPIEQKPTHNYPNADRQEGVPDIMPMSSNKNQNTNGSTTIGSVLISENQKTPELDPGTTRPLVHLSDVVTPKEEDKSYKTSTVHTFKDDMASEASKGNFSIGKIMTANSKKIHGGQQNNNATVGGEKKPLSAKIIIIPIVCILIVGGFSYIGLKSAKTPQEVALLNNPTQQINNGILYSEQSYQTDLTGKNKSVLYNEISEKVSSVTIPVGKIKSVIFTYKDGTSTLPIKASDFMNIVAPSAPDLLSRNLKDQYVFGYYSYDSNEPFIILKAANYDSVFAGMLDWENSMYADLNDLIYSKESVSLSNTQPTENLSSTTQSTTPTKATTSGATAKKSTSTKQVVVTTEYDTPFVDRVISNLDARVLYRPNGNIALFYAFFNKDTVIIATSEQTLREVVYRLTSGKITR